MIRLIINWLLDAKNEFFLCVSYAALYLEVYIKIGFAIETIISG